MLSQVSELLGIETHNIQNWVKRGFVKPPVMKKYTSRQFCRLVIINCFKDILDISDIVAFISYINGNLADESDDLMADDELYICFSKTLEKFYEKPFSNEALVAECKNSAKEYPKCQKELEKVLYIMISAYFSDLMRKNAKEKIKNINL